MGPWALPKALGKIMANLAVEVLRWALLGVLLVCPWALSVELHQWTGLLLLGPWALPKASGKTTPNLSVEALLWALSGALLVCLWASLVAGAKCHMANSAPSVKPRCLLHRLINMADRSTVALMDKSFPCSSWRQLSQRVLHVLAASQARSARCERRGRTVAECSFAAHFPKASSASSSSLPMNHQAQNALVVKWGNNHKSKDHHVLVVCPVYSSQRAKKVRTAEGLSTNARNHKVSNATTSSGLMSHHVSLAKCLLVAKWANSHKLKDHHVLVVCPVYSSQRAKKVRIAEGPSTSVQNHKASNATTSSGLMSHHVNLAKCISNSRLMAPHACVVSRPRSAPHAKRAPI